MKLLAIETATEACSAALWLDGDIHERFEFAPRRHTELILPMVDSLLAAAGLRSADMDGFVYGCGPGSFTGVRIATGVVQGLALAADRPVVAVSTLAALSQTLIEHDQPVLAALDARMDEVYWGCYLPADSGMQLQGAEHVCSPETVPLPETRQWLAAGSGWYSYAERLRARLPALDITVVADVWPRAAASVALAARNWTAGRVLTAAQARPTYLRDRVAQVKQST
ncbi:tRNA threonylcarbamoyladenosine biosynthesis protein TsaB [Methylohalomonas lacus]|uniref:tRNA threonylcarbamoyladenosine biosynthesis protein TsaB n=1 Tax=Methylohalomonas lacus TaxID=398773 RepID=A0AAE3HI37_9GAMM|nr:tRNA (adenosine(37)-N6)-threonylcarbamoyltransferase complex dimerization subunit type 1 TsaB [Methylohalomonas lacus]MCS3902751.1 tRNA threonylcarbamoyladenosine biosynthesis protein TsaB [Methylohalomonas lacus]